MGGSNHAWWKSWLWGFSFLAASLVILAGSFSEHRATLRVTAGSGSRYLLDQIEGEEDLTVLSRTASAEDAWLFVNGAWIDIGCQERGKTVVLDDAAVIAAASADASREVAGSPRQVSSPLFYHIHLLAGDPVHVNPPSAQDIHALVRLRQAFREARAGHAVGIMIDGRGKWTFDVTTDLAVRILRDDAGRADFAASHGYARTSSFSARFDIEYLLLAWDAMSAGPARTRNQRIEAFIDGARRLGAAMTYSE